MPPINLPDIDTLRLIEQVSQMVVVRACGMLYDHQIQHPQWELPIATLQTLIGEYGVGGVILLGGSAAEIALKTQQMQSWAKVPLLISADIEEGVGQRFSGATWFAPPMARTRANATKNRMATVHHAARLAGSRQACRPSPPARCRAAKRRLPPRSLHQTASRRRRVDGW